MQQASRQKMTELVLLAIMIRKVLDALTNRLTSNDRQ